MLNPTLLKVLMGDAEREGDWAGPSFHSLIDAAGLSTGPVKPRMIYPEAQQIPSPHFAITVAWVFPIHLRSSALLVAPGSFQKGGCSGLSHSGSCAGPAQGWTHGRLELLVRNDVGVSHGGFIAVPGRTHLPTATAGHTEVLSALPSPGVCKITGPQEDRPSPGLPSACPSQLSVRPSPGVAALLVQQVPRPQSRTAPPGRWGSQCVLEWNQPGRCYSCQDPLGYSCLEKPLYRGAWRATVHGVIESRARLKRLSARACILAGIGETLRLLLRLLSRDPCALLSSCSAIPVRPPGAWSSTLSELIWKVTWKI